MRVLIRFFLPLLLLITGAASVWSADGRILSFEGDVTVNGRAVSASTELHREDTIMTAAGASIKIVLSDNSVLDIDSDSEVHLSDYSYNPAQPEENKSEIGVVEGTLRYVSGLIAKEDPEDVGFIAGNSTIGVRGSFTAIEVDGVLVNVEAMIGEATVEEEQVDGKKDSIIVPTGQVSKKDPATGKILLAPATVPNAVNIAVHAIAAAAPDSANGLPTDEGCSKGDKPQRDVANPEYDAEQAKALADQLAVMSKGDLMMVMAVLINNARHLCIDSSAVASAIALIATIRPDAAADVVFVASLLDPDNANLYTDTAIKAAPDQAININKAKEAAAQINRSKQPRRPPGSQVAPIPDVPPGGGVDPSPE